MQFLHSREYLTDGQAIEVDCDTQCNVMLTDDLNFPAYTRGGRFRYYGGLATHFPARVRPPHGGHWNVTIDLAGRVGTIRSSYGIVG